MKIPFSDTFQPITCQDNDVIINLNKSVACLAIIDVALMVGEKLSTNYFEGWFSGATGDFSAGFKRGYRFSCINHILDHGPLPFYAKMS